MGDHFALLANRLLTESTLGAAIESRNRCMQATQFVIDDMEVDAYLPEIDTGDVSSPRKLVECRICQDEDEDLNMEAPCCCCGSLKYAHRRCVQRWCNEKGDTTCEICHQQFKHGYTAPPPLFQFRHIPTHFRRNWNISRTAANGPHIIAMRSSHHNFLDPLYDNSPTYYTRSFICCRSVAFIFMVLLVLRHTLPLIISGDNEYSFPLFLLILLRSAGIVLPIYAAVRAVTSIQLRRHHQQASVQYSSDSSSFTTSDEETENSTLQPHSQTQTHIIHVLAGN